MAHKILNYFLPLTLAVFAHSANGETADRQFVAQFQNYKAQHKLTTLATIKVFAAHQKMKPDALLKRLIAAEWDMGGNEKQKAVINGVEAFEQSGLSHEQALQKISDMTGQLNETLEYLYKQGRAAQPAVAKSPSGPAPASTAAPARKVAIAHYKRH